MILPHSSALMHLYLQLIQYPCKRTALVTVLPDSGADISAAGQTIVSILGHHLDNLAPSKISPGAVNGAYIKPVGKIPACKVGPVGMTCTFSRGYLVHSYRYHGNLPKSWAFCLPSAHIPRDYHRPNSTQRGKAPRQWTIATAMERGS